jgi:hypothetical protein
MKRLLFLLFLPLGCFAQQVDTVGRVKAWTDTTVTITYKIWHTYTLKRTDIQQQIIQLTEDSTRLTQDRVWWLQNNSDEMTRIRSEKRRLQRLLQ